jgi:hypothetical protein
VLSPSTLLLLLLFGVLIRLDRNVGASADNITNNNATNWISPS